MRHEKISLVVLAYIIGFTTAYIAFALDADEGHSIPDVVMVSEKTYAERSETADTHDAASGAVRMGTLGLVVEKDGTSRVISGTLRDGIAPGPGFHVDIPTFEVSPSGDYVYYCEQQTADADVCHEYIYSVAEHITRPLQVNDANLTAPIAASSFAWAQDGTVRYDGYTSVSAETPWLLTESN